MKRPLKKWLSLLLLLAAVVIVSLCYLTYNTYGNWSFALALRGKKLLAFIFVGIAAAFSTISFQTVTQNHFLTPNILGMDSLYVFVQTVLFFLLGGAQALGQVSLGSFLMNVFLTVFLSTSLSYFLLRKNQSDLFLLLMIGMILGTFFSSISTFLQVIMDPNEYDLLQGKLFASFGNVNSQYLVFVGVAVGRFPYSKGRLKSADHEKVTEALEQLGLTEMAEEYIDTLSGGQLQRAYIAMILAQDTDYILLDEPLNNLDMNYAVQMMQILKRLVDELGKTILIVLHDINFAASYADEIVAMKGGKLYAHGATEEVIQTSILNDLYEMNIRICEIEGKRFCLYH